MKLFSKLINQKEPNSDIYVIKQSPFSIQESQLDHN